MFEHHPHIPMAVHELQSVAAAHGSFDDDGQLLDDPTQLEHEAPPVGPELVPGMHVELEPHQPHPAEAKHDPQDEAPQFPDGEFSGPNEALQAVNPLSQQMIPAKKRERISRKPPSLNWVKLIVNRSQGRTRAGIFNGRFCQRRTRTVAYWAPNVIVESPRGIARRRKSAD
jgi:hypothetical protein